MDEKCSDYIIDQTAHQTQNWYLKKTLQFLVPISIISFLVSYFSVFPFILPKPQIYSSIYPFLAQALERKCMFLVCNGILAFLANSLKQLNTSTLNYGGFVKTFNDDDGDVHEQQLPEILTFQENAASHVEYAAVPEEKEIAAQQHQDDGVSGTEMVSLESEEWDVDQEEEYDDDESADVEDSTPFVNEMRVSTEELNKKFDEFIRRMKEEIRIEAREQYMIAV